MEEYADEVRLINVDGLSDFEQISLELRMLISSIAGTIPGSRGFGLSGMPVDMAPEEARNEFLAELDEKVEAYIPEIRIEDAEFYNNNNGRMGLRIFVERNDDMEGEDD